MLPQQQFANLNSLLSSYNDLFGESSSDGQPSEITVSAPELVQTSEQQIRSQEFSQKEKILEQFEKSRSGLFESPLQYKPSEDDEDQFDVSSHQSSLLVNHEDLNQESEKQSGLTPNENGVQSLETSNDQNELDSVSTTQEFRTIMNSSKIAEMTKQMKLLLLKDRKRVTHNFDSIRRDLEKMSFTMLGQQIPFNIVHEYILPFVTLRDINVSMCRLSKSWELASSFYPLHKLENIDWMKKRFYSYFKDVTYCAETGNESSTVNLAYFIANEKQQIPQLGNKASFSKHNVTTTSARMIWFLVSRSFSSFADSLEKRHPTMKSFLKDKIVEFCLLIAKAQETILELNQYKHIHLIIQRISYSDKLQRLQQGEDFALSFVMEGDDEDEKDSMLAFCSLMTMRLEGFSNQVSLFLQDDDDFSNEEDYSEEEASDDEVYEEDASFHHQHQPVYNVDRFNDMNGEFEEDHHKLRHKKTTSEKIRLKKAKIF
ncbi:hypothetical protein C9374_011278 [Naegleria lovaniensis]|uniref:Uncharacterized protein n=1 Tax=Naegleria lovaniensis TaxID=51637 RepID=A0AA88GWY8_NAELO|nr:uncharacterized protein C9374_011278 [Naegleria lovaniensis]KAG2392553.1 hypothetical protein C9374_011278 [Naegleria lovaniensis]